MGRYTMIKYNDYKIVLDNEKGEWSIYNVKYSPKFNSLKDMRDYLDSVDESLDIKDTNVNY